MSVMKLVNGGITVSFDPDYGYRIPDVVKKTHHRTGDGTMFSFKFWSKKKWVVPLVFIDKTDADQLNLWWSNIDALEFYPDLVNTPATKYNITMVNATRPLDSYSGPNFETQFKGKLELEEH
jgi:hypothetical protein